MISSTQTVITRAPGSNQADIGRVFVMCDHPYADSLVFSTCKDGVIEGTLVVCSRLDALVLLDDTLEEGFELISDTRLYEALRLSDIRQAAATPESSA